MLHELLTRVGFSSKEADLYLALLHIGSQPASVVASKVGYNRITTYQVLMDLVKRGVVSVSTRANVKYFVAEPPERILSFLECNKADFEEQINLIKNQLPVFQQLVNPNAPQPSVRTFVGNRGIRSIYEDTLVSTDELFIIQDLNLIGRELEDYIFDYYAPRRVKNGIKCQLLLPKDRKNKSLIKKDNICSRDIRYISQKEIPFKSAIFLYNEKTAVVLHKSDECFGAIIESPAFFSTMRGMFNILWAKGEKCVE
jgi:sugar-specific transcriptional regulator TrmB